MRDRLDELGANTVVVLITFTDESNLDAYQAKTALPFPILLDPDRSTYSAFGLGRGSFGRVWGLEAGRLYLEILRRDGVRHLRRPTEDSLQLGGDFIIGPDGSLIYGYWGAGPDDRPDVGELIDTLRHAAS